MKFILPILAAVMLSAAGAQAGEKYQTYMKSNCEWCGAGNSIFNALNVHHFYAQHAMPEWKNCRINTVTLCRKCHLIAHRRNFKRSVPEFCVLFGTTPGQVAEECEKETGVKLRE